MDEKGCQEGAVILLADKNEVWYMELLSGHQYCAVKYPDDAYSVVPNCLMLGRIDITDTKNVYASKDIINLPKKHGFLVEEDGLINLKKTYGEPLQDYNRDRIWAGINFLDSSKNIPHDAEDFELFQKTTKKISLEDVMELQRYRNEGTPLDANLAENKGNVRPIGVVEQSECHIIQIKKDYPKELGGILWLAMANAEHSTYVPIIGGTKESIKPYYFPGNQYTPESAYWTIRGVSALSELDRELYGKYVREYYKKEELRLVEEIKKLEKVFAETPIEKAIELSTKFTVGNLQKAYDDASLMFKELNTYFFDLACDGAYKEEHELRTPYVPSLLGEERLIEIYTELDIPLESGPAQPLEKPGEISTKIMAPATQTITINGNKSALLGYEIDGNIYYKLRGLAAALSGSEGQFNIVYDTVLDKIEIHPGETYAKLGNELSPLGISVIAADKNDQTIAINGVDMIINGYIILGHNYFKLDDISKYINVTVGYSEDNIELTTK